MKYVVYLTIYSGDKLPKFYIGSSSLHKVLNGYHGSILSKKWKTLYCSELSENPNAFDTCIIDEFKTREEALAKELEYQKQVNAVKNPNFMNMAYAAPNGFFGRNISGENHPLHGSHNCAGNIHSYNPDTLEASFLLYVPEGNVVGRIMKSSSHNKGKRWYNNGSEQKLMKDPSPEWVLGKLPGSASAAATKMWKRINHESIIHR